MVLKGMVGIFVFHIAYRKVFISGKVFRINFVDKIQLRAVPGPVAPGVSGVRAVEGTVPDGTHRRSAQTDVRQPRALSSARVNAGAVLPRILACL